jgi:acyl carrier protein
MQPRPETIIAELDRILVEQFELPREAVVPTALLREDLDLDSLDAADLLITIERRFGVRLDDNVARTFATVGEVHDYVRALVSDKAALDALRVPELQEAKAS